MVMVSVGMRVRVRTTANIRDVQPYYTHVEVCRANTTDGLSIEKFGDVGHKYMCVVRVMSV